MKKQTTVVLLLVATLSVGLATTASASTVSIDDTTVSDGEFEVSMNDAAVGEVVAESDDFGVELDVEDDDGDSVGEQTDKSVEFIDMDADDSTYTLSFDLDGSGIGEVTVLAATGDEYGGDEAEDETQETFSAESEDDVEDPDPPESGGGTVELLLEAEIDNDHACTHGEYDDRTPLEAGSSPSDAPVVEEDHVIWEVTYDGDEGYVRFDSNEHSVYPDLDSWVFYEAGADMSAVDATVLETGGVDECPSLDGYMEVETPNDGVIDIELAEDGAVHGPADEPEEPVEEEEEEEDEEGEEEADSEGEESSETDEETQEHDDDADDDEWTAETDETTDEETDVETDDATEDGEETEEEDAGEATAAASQPEEGDGLPSSPVVFGLVAALATVAAAVAIKSR